MAATKRHGRRTFDWASLARRGVLLGLCLLLIHQLTRAPDFREAAEPAPPEAREQAPEEVESAAEPQRMRVRVRTLTDPAVVQAESEPMQVRHEVAATTNRERSGKKSQLAQEFAPSESMISRGEQLVAELEKGEFPAIVADYRLHVGFHRYAHKMQELGARFFIMERGRGRLCWEVTFPGGVLTPASNLDGLSPRSRRIVGEPAAEAALGAARSRQPGSYDLVLLIPGRLEAYIVGALEQAAGRVGEDIRQFRVFEGRYHVQGDRLSLEFHRAGLKDGRTHALSLDLRI